MLSCHYIVKPVNIGGHPRGRQILSECGLYLQYGLYWEVVFTGFTVYMEGHICKYKDKM